MKNFIDVDNWWDEEPPRRRPAKPNDKDIKCSVVYYPLRCPKCNSKNVRCYCSNPPVRYHVCNNCDFNFKSVEDPGKSKRNKKEQKKP